MTGWEIGKASASRLLCAADLPTPSVIALVVAVVSILTKELLYQMTLHVGKAASSPVTIANAHHHRSDAMSSVVALVGIGGAQLGCPWADPLAGLVVTCFIWKTSLDIGRDALSDLSDACPDLETITPSVHRAVAEVEGAVVFRALRARRMGPFVALSLDLHVQPTLTVAQAAAVEMRVRDRILAASQCTDVAIRIVPASVPAYLRTS
eukprot:NODE_1590_length_831_cov_285.604859_g1233_i0.p1 GENE.NODE_1590_length_831_cov_285.604859_g1233_i0~~NODE_1590_length_831_cov_285.604859_g1233_i0.p1  ORF type:complete len:208 (-),score=46.61 NODE_1590_length_831_cov_285.604859_g1233_i0:60-683(-)